MSRIGEISYPPLNILNPVMGKADYEYIILWMLNNNELCTWADFTVKISGATLHGYLKKLMDKDYIKKPDKGVYQITSLGREKFSELVYDKKLGKRSLKYPPKAIMKRRNYDHWILWMLYNNYSCKWSDFKQEPLLINQSSLSNTINSLKDKKFISKDKKDYIITPNGKIEYMNLLKSYDLDRQSILEQKSKRIEEITEKTSNFFKRYNILDDKLKFRYIDYVLKLNYLKVKSMLKDEEDFNKILFFLTINHPDQYPNYISPEVFSARYKIDVETLKYYILEIVEKQFFQTQFFKIMDEQGCIYYFQQGETLEKRLNALVEYHITKFTYLNRFHQNLFKGIPSLKISQVIDDILQDICGNLFNEKLKSSLANFIQEDYIKYLAYKIEGEVGLIKSEDTLKAVAFQNVIDWSSKFNSTGIYNQEGEGIVYYNLDPRIFDTLEIFHLTKIDFFRNNAMKNMFLNLKYRELIKKVEKLLNQGKYKKAQSFVENERGSLDEIEIAVLDDLIETVLKNFKKSIKITDTIIDKFPNSFIGYLFQSITYLELNEFDLALEIINKGLDKASDITLKCQKAQILLKMYRPEEAYEIVENALLIDPNNLLLLRLKILISLTHTKCVANTPEEPLKLADSVLKKYPNCAEFIILKAVMLCIMKRFKEVKSLLFKLGINPLQKNLRVDLAYYFILVYSYMSRGKFQKALKFANQVLEYCSDHPISYLAKALVYAYDMIYKISDELNEEVFIEKIDRAISLDSNTSNVARYFHLKSLVYQNSEEIEKALKSINKAIELDPYKLDFYYTKNHILITTEKFDEALAICDLGIERLPQFKKNFIEHKSFVLFNAFVVKGSKHFIFDALKLNEKIYQENPYDTDILNDRSLLLAWAANILQNENKISEAKEKQEEAIKTGKQMIKLAPNIANNRDSYGEVLMRFNMYEESISEFNEALRLEPFGISTCASYRNLAYCYKALGNLDKAMEYIEKAIEQRERMLPSDRELFTPPDVYELKEKIQIDLS